MPLASAIRNCFFVTGLFLLGGVSGSCSDWYDDDDDCHTHVEGSFVFTHCHDDDFDDDDFDDEHSHIVVTQPQSAEAAALVTDSTHEALAAFHVDIDEIALLGSEIPPRPLHRRARDPFSVELVALHGGGGSRIYDVVSGRVEVPATIYDAVRVAISKPVVVLETGERLAGDLLELAGGGAIEVKFPEPVLVAPGDIVFVLIDIDLARSLAPVPALATAGAENAGAVRPTRWRFDPVVHVECVREELAGVIETPVDVTGTIAHVDLETRSIWLELGAGLGLLEATFAESAAGAGTAAAPLDLAALGIGDEITVRGRWGPGATLAAELWIRTGCMRRHGVVQDVERGPDGATFIIFDTATGAPRAIAIGDDTRVTRGRTKAAKSADLHVGDHVTVTVTVVERSGAALSDAIWLDLPAAESP